MIDTQQMNLKRYIGDGAYVNFDGFRVVLTTENGTDAYNTIFLEPSVLFAFEDYIKLLRDKHVLPPR